MSKIKDTYKKEIGKIINCKNNLYIFLVGSSKNINLEDEFIELNDIDVFVICNQLENQIREIKKIDDIEFDINYFSKKYADDLINNAEFFFINEMKDAKVVYACDEEYKSIINSCNKRYNEGPNNNKSYINKVQIYENITRLKHKNKITKHEYEFLTNLYLKDIIGEYFNIQNKWIPKDKKIFKYLSENDSEFYELVKCVYENYDYKSLEDVYIYVFGQIDEKSYIKIIY